MEEWLLKSLKSIGGSSGTIHLVVDGNLKLQACYNVPPQVRMAVGEIPPGKGMAGQAWLKNEPVQVCDLQSDTQAPIQPGARHVPARGAIAVPVHDKSGRVRGVVGFAFEAVQQLGEAEVNRLCELAESLPSVP